MIDLGPPPLILPAPAIIHPIAEPWERKLSTWLMWKGVPLAARLSVLAEMRRVLDTPPSQRESLVADLLRHGPLLGLGVTPQVMLAGFGNNATVSLTDHAVDTSDGTIYTFTSTIGTAAVGRRVIVACGTLSIGAQTSTCTIGGITATEILDVDAAVLGGHAHCAIYILQVDAGTTATIVVGYSSAALCCGIAVWAAYNLQSNTAVDTGTATANPFNDAINVSAGGILVSYAVDYAGSQPTHTWTNLTEHMDEAVEGVTFISHTAASDAFLSAQTGLSVTCTPSAFTGGQMVQASFR